MKTNRSVPEKGSTKVFISWRAFFAGLIVGAFIVFFDVKENSFWHIIGSIIFLSAIGINIQFRFRPQFVYNQNSIWISKPFGGTKKLDWNDFKSVGPEKPLSWVFFISSKKSIIILSPFGHAHFKEVLAGMLELLQAKNKDVVLAADLEFSSSKKGIFKKRLQMIFLLLLFMAMHIGVAGLSARIVVLDLLVCTLIYFAFIF